MDLGRSRSASTAAPCRSSSTPRRRRRLLEGLDDIGIALEHDDEISAYEAERERPGPVTTAQHTAAC